MSPGDVDRALLAQEQLPEQLEDGFSPPLMHGEEAYVLQFGEPALKLGDSPGEKSDF